MDRRSVWVCHISSFIEGLSTECQFRFGVLVAIVALVPLSHDTRMHTDVLVANNSIIVIPEQKQHQEEDKGSTLSKILRTNELLRYLDDHVFDDFLHLIEKRTFQKG